jgi:DNA-binding transcriptional LysR family regulator
MRRSLPRLEQIEAFIEAAGAPSFRVAAERCALSPAAFSRRIQAFSDHVGAKLFERTAGGARLTEAGRRCAEELAPAYLELRRAAEAVGQRDQRAIAVSLSHSLAVGWLIPRLDQFRTAHPDIDITLKTDRGAGALRRGEADIAICFSDIDLAGFDHAQLLDVAATPVAAPAVARRMGEQGACTLGEQRLLSLTAPADLWQWWSDATGGERALGPVTRFELIHAVYETASQGLGIAIGASPTVWPYLQSGRLEQLGLPVARFPGGYRIAAAADAKRRKPVSTLWRWLEAQAAATPCLA